MPDTKNVATKPVNDKGLAIFNVLKDAKTALTFAEIANLANIEPKTGYLTAAKKITKDNKFEIVKIEKAVILKVKTVTEYPTGLVIEKTKDVETDAYELHPLAD